MSAKIPTTWAELLPVLAAEADSALAHVDYVPTSLEHLNPETMAAAILASPASHLTKAMLARGPAACRDSIRRVEPQLEPALAQLRALSRPCDEYEAAGLLAFTNLAFCCGTPPSRALSQAEFDLPKELGRSADTLDEGPQQTLGFASLAVGLTPLVPRFLGGPPIEAPVTAGEVQGLDAKRFARYMAAALDQGLGADAVRPAFEDHVRRYPLKIAARSLEWYDLPFAARAFYTLFERRPLESVGQRLHELVVRLST